MTGRIYLNDGWYFTEEFTEELLFKNTEGLSPVRVPHTVKELPYHYFDESEYQMLSGYVRALFAEPEWEGGRVLLTFEGAAHEASVFINGQPAGTGNAGQQRNRQVQDTDELGKRIEKQTREELGNHY